MTIELGKWPRLLVVGDPVTPEQANEILVRTDDWHLCSNDDEFEDAIYDLVGIIRNKHGSPDWDSRQEFCESIGVLDLHYLDNSRIVSAWIGGPHGWCDWDGRIGCDNYNLGKWPSVREITEDWQAIATALPYLNLRAQVVAKEGEGEVAAEWTVTGGTVDVRDEGAFEPLTRPAEFNPANVARVLEPICWGRERGVTLDRLRQAVAQVRGAVRP